MNDIDYAKRIRVILLSVIGVVFLLCGFGGCALYRTFMASETDQLEARLAEARKLGLPWVRADLDPNPPIADKDNAAIEIKAILDASRKSPQIAKAFKQLENIKTRKIDPLSMKPILEALQPIFPAMRKAATKPSLDFHRDWDEGFSLLFPECAVEKHAVKALAAKAVLDANEGNLEAAATDLEAAQHIANLAAHEPFLIANLVSIGCRTVVQYQVQAVAAKSVNNPAVLGRLAKLYESEPDWRSFMKALRGEYYMALAMSRNISGWREFKQAAENDGAFEAKSGPLVRDGLRREEALRSMLSKITKYYMDVLDPEPKQMDDLVALGERMDMSAKQFDKDYSVGSIMTRTLLPTFSQAALSQVRNCMLSRVTKAYFKVLGFRAKNNRWPRNLEDMGPVPLDTFTGAPLKYRQTEGGFVVYSLDSDKVDDGGRSIKSKGQLTRDLSAEFPQ